MISLKKLCAWENFSWLWYWYIGQHVLRTWQSLHFKQGGRDFQALDDVLFGETAGLMDYEEDRTRTKRYYNSDISYTTSCVLIISSPLEKSILIE